MLSRLSLAPARVRRGDEHPCPPQAASGPRNSGHPILESWTGENHELAPGYCLHRADNLPLLKAFSSTSRTTSRTASVESSLYTLRGLPVMV